MRAALVPMLVALLSAVLNLALAIAYGHWFSWFASGFSFGSLQSIAVIAYCDSRIRRAA